MKTVTLEPRPLYAIGTVARLTGIKPDTLRVWERRYGLGASHKSSSGRRQYTQADLEHLQLVAALVASGTRIGEIAAAGRKTLEVMLRRHDSERARVPASKPTVLVIGPELCEWVEEHQGCLANVSALLARVPLAEAAELPADQIGTPDLVIVGCTSLGFVQLQHIQVLAGRFQGSRVVVSCGAPRERAVATLQQQGIATTSFPPESGLLAFEAARREAESQTEPGSASLGGLVEARPRQFSSDELVKVGLKSDGEAGAVADLVQALADFEQRMAQSPVADWQDAASRACAYAYAGQARWLMERALQVMLASPKGAAGPGASRRAPRALHDAA